MSGKGKGNLMLFCQHSDLGSCGGRGETVSGITGLSRGLLHGESRAKLGYKPGIHTPSQTQQTGFFSQLFQPDLGVGIDP